MTKRRISIPRFEELTKGYTMADAIQEAKRCLDCKKPLCVEGCPIEHDIPGFIHQLSMGNLGAALQIISEKSSLPAICGRVCPHEKQCEGHCILNKKRSPIRVGRLERFVADFDSEMELIKERLKAKDRGKVAVIGSGPAGLTVAGDLAKEGFNVLVYESQNKPGGVLLYGIPAYRLPNEIVHREIKRIESLGVSFMTNCIIGDKLTIDDLFNRGFDAIFIGSGTSLPKQLAIPGADIYRVVQSSYFLRMVSLFNDGSINRSAVPLILGETVAVIGAGNVAMDTARTAIRMGAKSVTVIYYKGENDISALKSEYQEAIAEGVKFLWHTNTMEFIRKKNKLESIRVQDTDGERIMHIDRVFIAVGSRPANRIVSTSKGIDVDDRGYVITKSVPYGMTTRRGVFAGGDVVHTPQTVVLAMREAKLVAKGIAQYIDALKLLNI
jgi:glutamate synthase (NADPH/NADH) small chain